MSPKTLFSQLLNNSLEERVDKSMWKYFSSFKNKKLSLDENDYENIYVISDIHGHIDIFEKALEKLILNKNDLFVIAGDSCDRGEGTSKVYKKTFQLIEDGYKIIHLLGNHEEMLLNYFLNNTGYYTWTQNGGAETLKSYKNKDDLLKKHLAFMKSMFLYIETENYIIVHAGIDCGSMKRLGILELKSKKTLYINN
ncbi:MAG: metallophosphoesterase [Candidatus Woesearchaeota archaeon]